MLSSREQIEGGATVGIVIVTHDSQQVIDGCLKSILEQTVDVAEIIIVDSGSEKTGYLDKYEQLPYCTVLGINNIGFAAANNRGIGALQVDSDFVLLVNPDMLLAPDCLEKCLKAMQDRPAAAVVTGALLGYDMHLQQATERYDSTGIFRTWYGRWYDRDHGTPIKHISRQDGEVPAICGALMFCRSAAIEPELPELFDESFFMYKEDIELSLRLRKKGWKLYFFTSISAFHGRGWSAKRHDMARKSRLMAARNEIRLYQRHPSPYILWAILKFSLVKLFNV